MKKEEIGKRDEKKRKRKEDRGKKKEERVETNKTELGLRRDR